jgi:flavodoxin
MVIYDSKTGNTEKMAKAIADAIKSIKGVTVDIKKIGVPFPLTMLDEADFVFFGSPCHYANVTPSMQDFIEGLKNAIKAGKIHVKGKNAAIFGSYGWDGAWVMEERFTQSIQNLGYKVTPDVCVEVGSSIEYHPDDHLDKCRTWATAIVKNLKNN